MKKAIAIMTIIMLLSVLLTACGEDKNQTATEATSAPASTAETVKPSVKAAATETTAPVNTVETTSDNYTLEKNKDGEIVVVTDPNGKTVSVDEYRQRHAAGEGSASSGSQNDASSKAASKPESASSKGGNSATSSQPEMIEEEIPTVVVEIPDSAEGYELPII